MNHIIHPIVTTKPIFTQTKKIGRKKGNINSNISFAQDIISEHSSIWEYDFDFDSFIYVNIKEEDVEKVSKTAAYVIELLFTMNHSVLNLSLNHTGREYFEMLNHQVEFYLSQLKLWGDNYFESLQVLYSRIQNHIYEETKNIFPMPIFTQFSKQSVMLTGNKEERVGSLDKQIYREKSKLNKWKNNLTNKKKTECYSLSRPFYQMMNHYMESKKKLNYKEIWRLSTVSKERMQIENQKFQYINHWNSMSVHEQERIRDIFVVQNITEYLPEQVAIMEKTEWLHFMRQIKNIEVIQNEKTFENNIVLFKNKLINIVKTIDDNDFIEEIIHFIIQDNQLKNLNGELWSNFYDKLTEQIYEKKIENIIHNFFLKVKNFETEYNEVLNNQGDDIRCLSLKTQFIESIDSIESQEELSGIKHFLFQYKNLSESLKQWGIHLEEQIEAVVSNENLKIQKDNIKEFISYLEVENWNSLFTELKHYEKRKEINRTDEVGMYRKSILNFLDSVDLSKTSSNVQLQTEIYVMSEFLQRIVEFSNQYKNHLRDYVKNIQTIDKENFLNRIENSDHPEEILSLIHMAVQNSSMQEEKVLLESLKRQINAENTKEESIVHQREKLKEIIKELDGEKWEVFSRQINKLQKTIEVIDSFPMQTNNNVMFENKMQIIETVDQFDKPEEFISLIHLAVQNSSMEERDSILELLKKNVDLEKVKEESIVYQREKLKEFIRELDGEKWEVFSRQISKFSKTIEKIDNFHMESNRNMMFENKTQLIETVDQFEKPEEFIHLIHLAVQSSSMEERDSILKLLNKNLNLDKIKEESIVHKREKLKEFIKELDSEKWEVFSGQINKFNKTIEAIDNFNMQTNKNIMFENKVQLIETVDQFEKPEEFISLIHLAVQNSSMEEKNSILELLNKNVNIDKIKEESIVHQREKLKKFIKELDSEKWEVFSEQINKFNKTIEVIDNFNMQTNKNIMLENKTLLIKTVEQFEKPEDFIRLIHLAVQNSSMEEKESILELLKKNVNLEKMREESILNQRNNLKEFIRNLKNEKWEVLYKQLKKVNKTIEIIEQSVLHTDQTELIDKKDKLLKTVEQFEKPEEFLNLVYMAAQDSTLSKDTELLKFLNNKIKKEETQIESIEKTREKIKEVIYTLKNEQWDMLYNKFTKFNHNIRIFDNAILSKERSLASFYKSELLTMVEQTKESNELISMIHMAVQKSPLKEETRLLGRLNHLKIKGIQDKSIYDTKKKIKEIIHSLDNEKTEIIFKKIKDFSDSLKTFHEIEKDKLGKNLDRPAFSAVLEQFERPEFLAVLEQFERPEDLTNLIYLATQNSSIQNISKLYEMLNSSTENMVSTENYVNNKKLKLKEFVYSLDAEKWQVLKEQIGKVDNILRGFGNNRQEEWIKRDTFLETIGMSKKQEEIFDLIHLSVKNSSIEEIDSYKILQQSISNKDRNEESKEDQKQKLKNFIQDLEEEKWNVLQNQLRKFENYKMTFHSWENDLLNSQNGNSVNIVEENVHSIAKQERVLQYYHGSTSHRDLSNKKNLINQLEYYLSGEINSKEELIGKKELEKFIYSLNKAKEKITYHALTEQKKTEEILDKKHISKLSYIIHDYLEQIQTYNKKYEDRLVNQSQEVKMLSYKTHFLESIDKIQSLEDFQSVVHLLSSNEHLKKQAELFEIAFDKNMNSIEEQSLINQKNQLKEMVSYLEIDLWEDFYKKMTEYHKEQNYQKEISDQKIITSQKQYELDRLPQKKLVNSKILYSLTQFMEKLEHIKSSNYFIGIEKRENINKLENSEHSIVIYKKNRSLTITKGVEQTEDYENKYFQASYEPAQMLVVSPVVNNKKLNKEITPDITHEIQSSIKDKVDDIEHVVGKKYKTLADSDISKQIEYVTKTMETYQKEMEQIKLSQSKILQSTSSNQITDKVMKQLKGQLRLEKMRRGLD